MSASQAASTDPKAEVAKRVPGGRVLVMLQPTFVILSLLMLVVAGPSDFMQSRSAPKTMAGDLRPAARSGQQQLLKCEWESVARMPDGPLRSHCLMEISSAFFH